MFFLKRIWYICKETDKIKNKKYVLVELYLD